MKSFSRVECTSTFLSIQNDDPRTDLFCNDLISAKFISVIAIIISVIICKMFSLLLHLAHSICEGVCPLVFLFLPTCTVILGSGYETLGSHRAHGTGWLIILHVRMWTRELPACYFRQNQNSSSAAIFASFGHLR